MLTCRNAKPIFLWKIAREKCQVCCSSKFYEVSIVNGNTCVYNYDMDLIKDFQAAQPQIFSLCGWLLNHYYNNKDEYVHVTNMTPPELFGKEENRSIVQRK